MPTGGQGSFSGGGNFSSARFDIDAVTRTVIDAFPGPVLELRRTARKPRAARSPAKSPARSPAKTGRGARAAPRARVRYANVVLLPERGRTRLDARKSIAGSQVFRIRVDIGALSRSSHVVNPSPVPEDRLPKDIDLDVMVSSTDFSIVADSGDEGSDGRIAHAVLHLPADGGHATTRDGGKYLYFTLKAPDRAPEARKAYARIGYYYRNILVQSQQLAASIGRRGGFKIVTDFTISADLTDLDALPKHPRVSIFTNANGNGDDHQIVLRRPGTPSGAAHGSTITIRDAPVSDTLARLRQKLSLFAPDGIARPQSLFARDLRELAPIGWDLYTQLPGQLPSSDFGDLFDHPENYVIQVGRPTSSSFTLPWAFLYDIPLTSKGKPTLCPIVQRWDGRKPLFEGMPRQCPCGPHEEDVICPFGFWGVRYSLEQLASSDRLPETIPVARGASFVVCEAQYGIDARQLAAHVKNLDGILRSALPHVGLQEGKDLATIRNLLGQDLPFVYFYCHGERGNVADPNTWLGVGNRETLSAGDFIGWTRKWWQSMKKRIWGDVRPLIFINACHSLAIEAKTMVSYVDAFIGNGRAAGVIGTEVKVAQTMAIDFAQRFYGSWLGGQTTVESALREARMDYLRQGNLFGLVYTPYCWAELKVVPTSGD